MNVLFSSFLNLPETPQTPLALSRALLYASVGQAFSKKAVFRRVGKKNLIHSTAKTNLTLAVINNVS